MRSGTHESAPTFDLLIVAIVRNEARYVEEWIAYHHLLGADHFVIYDNFSDDDLRPVLRRYIAHGLVTLVDWPVGGGQVAAYRHAAHFFAPSSRWFLPLDLDEFVVPKIDRDLAEMIERLDATCRPDRIVLPWRNFGMGGHRSRPEGLVIERFRFAEDVPEHGVDLVPCKAILRATAVRSLNVHTHSVTSDRTTDGEGRPVEMVDVRVLRPSFTALQLNHYVTKSEEELAAKVRRGEANRALPREWYRLEDETGFTTEDRSIERFAEPTRAHLADLRRLTDDPFRYGSRIRLREPHSDLFVKHATLAACNHAHGMRRVRNGTRALPNLVGAGLNAYVTDVDGGAAPPSSSFVASIHFDDLVRRLAATVVATELGCRPFTCSHVEAGWEIGVDVSTARIEFGSGPPDRYVHHAVIGTVVVAGDATLAWGTDGSILAAVDLPGPGRFAAVIELDRTAAVAGRPTLWLTDPLRAARFDDLALVRYG